MTVVGVLQARMSSSRLPRKVLSPIVGKPMISLQLERLQRAKQLDLIIVATSDHESDTPLASLCAKLDMPCFRGSINDVLGRIYEAVRDDPPSHVVRLTGDCPLADPEVIDAVVSLHIKDANAYTSNVHPPTWPDGLDVEVIRFDALEAAWREAEEPFEREHVTPFIVDRPERFKTSCLRNDTDLSGLRWTVDESEDLEFVQQVYEHLYGEDATFDTGAILELLMTHPDIAEANSCYLRNAGSQRLSQLKSDNSIR